VVALLAQNYAAAEPIVVVAAVIAAVVIAIGIIVINRRAYSRIEELEDV